MPRIAWDSENQKALEWRVAKNWLADAANGTKIKRAHKKIPIDYVDPNDLDGPKVHLDHSFIKIGEKILAMAGEGKYLGEGAFGKVKLAEDEEGNLYALKIGHKLGGVSQTEQGILVDVGVFQGSAKRPDRSKAVVALSYLGTTLNTYNFESDSQQEFALFSAANELNLLHLGKLSKTNVAYVHRDIKPPNIVFNGNKSSLVDFGLTKKATQEWEGQFQRNPNRGATGTKGYQSPEILGERIYSYKSDIYALGISFREILIRDSPLRPIAILMCSEEVMSRPSLELVKVAFLAEIHKGSDVNLSQALEEHGCVVRDPNLAKDIYQTLTDQSQSFSFIQLCNYLQACFHPVSLTSENWQQLLENPNLQKAGIALRQTGVDFKDDWQQLLENPNLQKAVIALGQTGVDFKDDWQQLLGKPNLQKVVIKNDQELQKDYYPKLKKYEKHCLDNQSDSHLKWQDAKAFSQIARVCAKNYLMGADNSFVSLQDTNNQMKKLSQHRDNLALRAAGTFALSLLGLPLVWGLSKAAVRAVQGKPFEFLFLGATESQKKAESVKSAGPAA